MGTVRKKGAGADRPGSKRGIPVVGWAKHQYRSDPDEFKGWARRGRSHGRAYLGEEAVNTRETGGRPQMGWKAGGVTSGGVERRRGACRKVVAVEMGGRRGKRLMPLAGVLPVVVSMACRAAAGASDEKLGLGLDGGVSYALSNRPRCGRLSTAGTVPGMPAGKVSA